jgi:hypothetical protein
VRTRSIDSQSGYKNELNIKYIYSGMCWSAVVGWDTCYAPQKPKALRCSHIWVDPAHMSYRGISPPRTDVTKKFISIYGHDDALVAVWLMVKQMPASRRKNYQIWSPAMQYDSSHSVIPSAIVWIFFTKDLFKGFGKLIINTS